MTSNSNHQEVMSEVLIPPYDDYWGECCCGMDSSSDSEDDHDREAESKEILQAIETISKEIKESEFYSQLNKQINGVEFQRHLTRVIRSSDESDKVPMVIYALGSLKKRTQPRHQLAIALLLQKDLMSDWISERPIEVYDPKLSKADRMVLQELGCTVLSVNEKGMRRVERPTLFFMPYSPCNLEANLMQANWSSSNINHVILLTNKISQDLKHHNAELEEVYGLERPLRDDLEESYDGAFTLTERMEFLEAIQKCIQAIKINGKFSDIYLNDLKDVTDNIWLLLYFLKFPIFERMQYLEAISNYTQEIEIPSFGDLDDEILDGFSFHFFNVAPEIDMNTLLPDEEELKIKFRSQFDKLPKMEEWETIDLFEASIFEALRSQMEAESAL